MKKKVITLVIATTSEDKIQGIKEGFLQYFPEESYSIKIYSSKAESNVSNQPFGNDTYQGAYNRITNIREKYEEAFNKHEIDINYYVSCEAGIDDTNKVFINGNIIPIYSSEQIVCIYNPENDSHCFGKSSSWIIPEEDIEEIKNTDLDQYLRKRGYTGLHDVGNGNYITRKDAVIEGTRSAIATMLFLEKRKENQIMSELKDNEIENPH